MDIDIDKLDKTLLSNFLLNTIENEALTNIEIEKEKFTYLADGDLNKTFNNINDSNYVSEESVTLTDGSIDKYDDSLEYQADDLNSDSINVDNVENDFTNEVNGNDYPTNEDNVVENEVLGENHFKSESTLYEEFSISDEIDDNVEHEDKIEIESDNIDILSDNSLQIDNDLVVQELQDAVELKNDDLNEIETNENGEKCDKKEIKELESEVELHNNAYIDAYSADNTDGDMIIGNECEKSTDTNVTVCVSQEIKSTNHIAASINDTEMIVNLTSNLDLNEIKSTNQIQPSFNELEMKNISSDIDLNKINVTNQNRSCTNIAEMSNNSSDMDTMDLNEHEFTSCSWLYSVSSVSKDEQFDIELLSFGKMNLIASQFNNSSSLNVKLSWDCGKANNSHRYSQNRSIAQHVSPISVAKSSIVTSTPMAFKSRNTAKEVENLIKLKLSNTKDTVKPFKNTFTAEEDSTEMLNADSADEAPAVSLVSKPGLRVPNLNETVVIGNNQSVTAPKIMYKPDFRNGKVSPTLGFMLEKSKKPHGSLSSVIPRVNQPKDNSGNPEKSTKSDSESSLTRKPIEAPKSKMMPPSLRPPSRIAQKKIPSKETGPSQPDPNLARRHSSVGENESAVPNKTSRPTSLMKPSEIKPPLGLSRISRSFRSTLAAPTTDMIANLAPNASSLGDTGVSKLVPLTRKSRIQRMLKAPVQNENARTGQSDVVPPTDPIISTPIQCDNLPIISPSVNAPINPLNRTFDREQFQLLKSFTNSSGNNNDDGESDDRSDASSSTLRSGTPDSDGNNNSSSGGGSRRCTMGGIYQLAKREEDDLKKHVNSALMRQATAGAYRSLKLPSQIRPRGLIPTVTRK